MATQDIDTSIYGGKYSIKFRSGNHRYYVNGKPRPGVTTIMGKVLAKDGLMLWPLNMALKHLTPLVPTITHEDLEEARQAHIRRRDGGADTGTIVHSLVEQCLSQQTTLTDVDFFSSPEVIAAYTAFTKWYEEVKPTTIAVEQVVYSLTHDYAGTFDSILKIDDKIYLCDLKTTNASQTAPRGVYAEYFIQLGAYYYAYEEQRQYELAHGGTDLVQIEDLMIISCRKDGKMDTCTASELGLDLDTCMKMWTSTLFLHNSLARVKRKLGGR